MFKRFSLFAVSVATVLCLVPVVHAAPVTAEPGVDTYLGSEWVNGYEVKSFHTAEGCTVEIHEDYVLTMCDEPSGL
jgi:hypothetical protein